MIEADNVQKSDGVKCGEMLLYCQQKYIFLGDALILS
jgi:hypothetical protein